MKKIQTKHNWITRIALTLLLISGAGGASAAICPTGDEVPPFLTAGVDPNLLLLIDNSSSMYDLAYVDEQKYCYDDSYNPASAYAGYFEQETWYAYANGDSFEILTVAEATALCGIVNTRKKTHENANNICLTLTSLGDTGQFVSLAAKGNFLNWVAASKLDIEKKILTGGKYEEGKLVMESRGCLERRFVKQTAFDGAEYFLTLAVRPPNAGEKSDASDLTSRIELFPAKAEGYDHEVCQAAVNLAQEGADGVGQLSGPIQECMGYEPGGQNPESASQTAFNHSLQNCWYLSKHNKWPPGNPAVDIRNDCQDVYNGAGNPGINPTTITTDHSGYVCYGDYSTGNVDPPGGGYVGRCWNHGSVLWHTNNKNFANGGEGWGEWVNGVWVRRAPNSTEALTCIDSGLRDYCLGLNIPEVVDPSDQVSGPGDATEEFWNLPAVLVDSGVQGQLGVPLAVLKAQITQPSAPSGLLHEFAADLRVGAMTFNQDGAKSECDTSNPYVTYNCTDASIRDGGRIITEIDKGAAHTTALVSAINNIVADTWTPMGEAMFNAIGYYTQRDDMQLDAADFTIAAGSDPVQNWCQKNNVLLITDGASTADQNTTMENFVLANINDYGGGASKGRCDTLHGSTYFADLTKYGWQGVNVFPAQLGGNDKQPIRTYVVTTGTPRVTDETCSPATMLPLAAENGGTTLYTASDPDQLEAQLRAALENIRAGAAAGSAASVISASRTGEGAVYQAIFWPEKTDGAGRSVKWAGEVHALFVDAQGKMYEDTDQDGILEPNDPDKRVVIYYDETDRLSKACYGELVADACPVAQQTDIATVKYLWSANDWLAELTDVAVLSNRATADFTSSAAGEKRYIFTWNDLNGDGLVDAAEIFDFAAKGDEAGWATLIAADGRTVYRDLGATTASQADEIINWVRGFDNQAGMRQRQIALDGGSGAANTWRLGDVIHSMPTAVSRPAEGYHFLYRDASFAKFASRHNKRRHVVYFGGNDGMLHAVNAGFYQDHQRRFCRSANCVEADEAGALPLGAELWAYVPYNLWPHLQCLTTPEYGHKYYVDLTPRVYDVQIFTEEAACTSADNALAYLDPGCIHPGGWGTILVGGMRFGGQKVGATDVLGLAGDDRIFTSAFFVLDITNPEAPPTLLAEMTYENGLGLTDLGFTTSFSTVVPMKASANAVTSEWYLILGSGPTTSDGISTQQGKVAVLSLKSLVDKTVRFRIPDDLPAAAAVGDVGPEIGRFPIDNNSFAADQVTVDYDLNYKADVVYFGTVSGNFGGDGLGAWGGKLYRLVTLKKEAGEQVVSKPSEWANLLGVGKTNPHPLINAGKPVTAAPAVGWDGTDYWIYFGTGRLFDRKDKSDTHYFNYYGIKEPRVDNEFTWEEVELAGTYGTDPAVTPPGSRGLLEVTDIKVAGASSAALAELSCEGGGNACLAPATGPAFNNFAELQTHLAGRDGWWRKFELAGERNLGEATLLGGLLTFATYMPSEDPCSPEGYSYLYGLYYKTGTAYYRSVFGDTTAPEEVSYRMDIGVGLAITPSLHVGTDTGAKAVLQTSTGAIVTIDQPSLPNDDQKSGRESWRER